MCLTILLQAALLQLKGHFRHQTSPRQVWKCECNAAAEQTSIMKLFPPFTRPYIHPGRQSRHIRPAAARHQQGPMGLLSHMANAHMHLQLCILHRLFTHIRFNLLLCRHILSSHRGYWHCGLLVFARQVGWARAVECPHRHPAPRSTPPSMPPTAPVKHHRYVWPCNWPSRPVVERVPQCCGLYFGFKSCVAACCSGHLLPCNTYISCIIFQREGHRQEGSAAT